VWLQGVSDDPDRWVSPPSPVRRKPALILLTPPLLALIFLFVMI